MQSEEKTDETDHGLQKKKEKNVFMYILILFFSFA